MLLISDNCVSLGIKDGDIGPPQIFPSPLILGAHCLHTVLAKLVRGALTPLEAVRARYQHRQLLPTAVGPGRPGASGHCSVLIALCLIGAEELGHCVDLTPLPAVDFHEPPGSDFSETFELVPNHPGTSQRGQFSQKFLRGKTEVPVPYIFICKSLLEKEF